MTLHANPTKTYRATQAVYLGGGQHLTEGMTIDLTEAQASTVPGLVLATEPVNADRKPVMERNAPVKAIESEPAEKTLEQEDAAPVVEDAPAAPKGRNKKG